MKSWHLLSGLLMATFTSTTHAASVPSLFSRDAPICATNNTESPCSTDNKFCCSVGTSCVLTTTNSDSVVCCPNGLSCNFLRTISCDIQQQNSTQNPLSSVQTTNLGGQLPTCGDQCCPFGYTCQNGMCSLSKSSTSSSSSSTSTAQASSTTAAVVVPTTSPTSSATPAASSTGLSSSAAVGIGIVVGLALILIPLAVWLILRRRKQQRKHHPGPLDLTRQVSSPSFMGKTPTSSHEQYRPSFIASSTNSRDDSRNVIAPPPTRQNTSKISDPMMTGADSELRGPQLQLNRTDFLLRRGSCETGYENANKPTWSTKQSSTGVTAKKSQPSMKDDDPLPLQNPFVTPEERTVGHEEMATRADRLPLFAKPLRFNAPPQASIGQSPGRKRPQPSRPPRSGDYTEQSGTIESERNIGMRPPGLNVHPKRSELEANPARKGSWHSNYSGGSKTTSERTPSGETINILLTPEPPRRRGPAQDGPSNIRNVNRDTSATANTTFSDLLRQAGLSHKDAPDMP